jgi:hypothetical protein
VIGEPPQKVATKQPRKGTTETLVRVVSKVRQLPETIPGDRQLNNEVKGK